MLMERIQILAQGAFEEARILRDQRDALPQTVDRYLCDIKLGVKAWSSGLRDPDAGGENETLTPPIMTLPPRGSTKRNSAMAKVDCEGTDIRDAGRRVATLHK